MNTITSTSRFSAPRHELAHVVAAGVAMARLWATCSTAYAVFCVDPGTGVVDGPTELLVTLSRSTGTALGRGRRFSSRNASPIVALSTITKKKIGLVFRRPWINVGSVGRSTS